MEAEVRVWSKFKSPSSVVAVAVAWLPKSNVDNDYYKRDKKTKSEVSSVVANSQDGDLGIDTRDHNFRPCRATLGVSLAKKKTPWGAGRVDKTHFIGKSSYMHDRAH
ncbi:hypothetical protein FRC14_004785 [Serendipita sp. 396]|nr:hypothetical protein FRC14_004785 [Serendipita sp. 396]KAG8789333.1 hypothetical protein FRC15_009385 [Serendipita sp. 397]KAG8804567.1 hypothetical protein FRC16_006009 [Serendipita sp. 398]KAG8878688.1 hypothetical protein FRC20_006365 [Serendipita sp. 405]KAG9056223.1 hypothetical protein FS842_011322 [Serendipita sp. 407]